MTYQIDIMNELIIDSLPPYVKPYIVKRGYWLPDEAASVYAKSSVVISFDCHSNIIAMANGVPFIYLRQPEDTIKGQMYYDLNFSKWIFEINQTTGKQIAKRLKEIWENYDEAKNEIQSQSQKINYIYKNACQRILDILYQK